MSVSCWPKIASCLGILSVSFGLQEKYYGLSVKIHRYGLIANKIVNVKSRLASRLTCMKFLLPIVSLLFWSISANASSASKEAIEAEYIGDLEWKAQDFLIRHIDTYIEEETGPFKTINSVWGSLKVLNLKALEGEDLRITTTNVDEINKAHNERGESNKPNWYKQYAFERSLNPYLSDTFPAKSILEDGELLKLYLVKKTISPEYKKWKADNNKYEKELKKYNSLSAYQKQITSAPIFSFWKEPERKEIYTVIKTISLNIPATDQWEDDYWELIESIKLNANAGNIGWGIAGVLVLIFIWLVLRAIIRGTKKLTVSAHDKVKKTVQEIKVERHKADVRKLAEAAAISEVVKREVQESSPDEINQIRKKIAEAIESGDDERAETLLKMAERMKRLDE